MALPHSLPSLSEREAVTDALYRCVNGLDMADTALFDSAFTSDAKFDLNGQVLNGLAEIHTGCYDLVAKLDTTHFLTDIRVDVQDGASKATATATALAQHYRPNQGTQPGAANCLTGTLYHVDLVKDSRDGLWKTAMWKLKIIWLQGDMGILRGD